MFTGIIEQKSNVIEVIKKDQSLEILLERPQSFDDIHIGDSIACNGVCLTVEKFNDKTMQFTVGYETLQVTHWTEESLLASPLNLERSLRFGDRIHGHMVSGHVDNQSQLINSSWQGECLLLDFTLPDKSQNSLIWEKSSVAINGVSLTVNKVDDQSFQVCLVPETLKKTNLDTLKINDWVNVETDYYMKGLLNSQGVLNAQCT